MASEVRLEKFKNAGGVIREIDTRSESEIEIVAQRMRQTHD